MPIVIIGSKMEKIKIGRIVSSVALRGEVKVYHYSDYKERFEELESILVDNGKSFNEYEIEGIRYQKNMAILKLKGVDDRNKADSLNQKDIYILENQLRELPEGTYYVKDLIGCSVIHSETGEDLGRIIDVIQNTAQDIYEIKNAAGKEFLIPAVAQFVKKIDINNKTVIVNLIPGLIE